MREGSDRGGVGRVSAAGDEKTIRTRHIHTGREAPRDDVRQLRARLGSTLCLGTGAHQQWIC